MLVSPPQSSVHNGLVNDDRPALNMANNSAPLRGVVICCTSVPDEKRAFISAQAEQMGAIHRFDLTLDVTHLIVGHHESEKYRYVARERNDVRPMSVGWIEAVRDCWINDQDVDLEELERLHVMPVFHMLKFSMTGCDDAMERNNIAEKVKANGGVYEGDLTKQITHLISFRTEGPKYKAARNWGLKIVSIEWLHDTLERGMILNEKLYDPTLAASERGNGAWDKAQPIGSSLKKRTRSESTTGEGGKKRLRRSASAKINSQNSHIWGEIVSGAKPNISERSGQWEVSDTGKLTSSECMNNNVRGKDKPYHNQVHDLQNSKTVGIFGGHHFAYYGFSSERARILENHLQAQGALIHNTLNDLVSSQPSSHLVRLFVIIPHDLPSVQQHMLPPSSVAIEVVTVWWLERCLHSKALLEPKEHIIGQPFPTFPIQGFERFTISTSGFSGIDLLHITKAIRLLGGVYSEHMTAQNSVIMVKALQNIRKDKYAFAREWKIPIVCSEWLWESIKASTSLPFQAYLVRTEQSPQHTTSNATIADLHHIRAVPRANQPVKVMDTTSVSSIDARPRSVQAADSAPAMTEFAEQDMGTALEHVSNKADPLSERSINLTSQPISTAPAPPNHPLPAEDMISNLLTKTKSATTLAQTNEINKNVRHHKRILGRAASNMSSTSASRSRGASSECEPENRDCLENSDDTSLNLHAIGTKRIDLLFRNYDDCSNDVESQPPMTQLRYDDPQSKEAEERAMARMLGMKDVPERTLEKSKPLTLKDVENLEDKPRVRRSRR